MQIFLQYSHQVQVFSHIPLIRETSIQEAWGEFNWRNFLNNRWIDTSDPVGSALTTGGPPRYRNNQWEGDFGARRKNQLGGQVELRHEMGFQNTNSLFFVPSPQGTSRLVLNYTQPILNGAGKPYNTGLIVLAKIDAAAARDEFSRQLQSHLLEVARAYWSLYRERSRLVQLNRLYQSAREIEGKLQARRDIDAARSQLVRVQAAVAERRSEIIRQEAAIKNAEARLRSLVNDPSLGVYDVEFVPRYVPSRTYVPVDLQAARSTAMAYRPELMQTLKQIRAASVRVNMAENEILPALNLVLETYVAGLRGDTNIGGAWRDQFSKGEPSYTLGVQFEYVLCNDAARARLKRRELERRQLQSQFETSVATLMLEVEVAVRELETAYSEITAKYQAMQASRAEVEYMTDRWELLPGEEQAAPLYLDNLLQAQARQALAEAGFADAEFTYNLAQLNLKRATGTLLQDEQVTQARVCIDGLPAIDLHRPVGSQR